MVRRTSRSSSDPSLLRLRREAPPSSSGLKGRTRQSPPPGFEDYFGAGPLYRFIEYDGIQAFDILEKIRDFPEGKTAEDTMRLLMGEEPAETVHSITNALQGLIDIIDEDPEIEVC